MYRRNFNPIRLWAVIVLTAVVILVAAIALHLKANSMKANTLRRSNHFSQATMQKIKQEFKQMNVQPGTYLLTGGLGDTKPRIDSIGSDGSMEFQTQRKGYTFTIKQNMTNPSQWTVQNQSSNGFGVSEFNSRGMRIPWVEGTTKGGHIYYKWHPDSMMTWFYFKKNNTYILVQVVAPGIKHFPFPSGIISHLKPYTTH